MDYERTLERISSALEGLTFEQRESRDGLVALAVERAALHDVLERLRDAAGFSTITLVTAVDRLPQSPRFELHHQLLALEYVERVRVTTRLLEDDAKAPTCTDLWPGAAYMERECYDMFGIDFEGHDNLRRLLMPEGYGHHPLRKDFPHSGIEPDRLYREWDRERQKQWQAQLSSEEGGR